MSVITTLAPGVQGYPLKAEGGAGLHHSTMTVAEEVVRKLRRHSLHCTGGEEGQRQRGRGEGSPLPPGRTVVPRLRLVGAVQCG